MADIILFIILNRDCSACSTFQKAKVDQYIESCAHKISSGQVVDDITQRPTLQRSAGSGPRNVSVIQLYADNSGNVSEKSLQDSLSEIHLHEPIEDLVEKINKCVDHFPSLIAYHVHRSRIVSTYSQKVIRGDNKNSISVIHKSDTRNPLLRGKVGQWLCGAVYKADF